MPIDNIRRGENYLHDGTPVWIEHKINRFLALVCNTPQRELTDTYSEVRISELQPIGGKRGYTIKKQKPVTEAKNSFKKKLNTFFDNQGLKIPFNCQNCNKPLYAKNKFAKRCVTAHILPKSKFQSVATNEHNVIYIGAGVLGVCFCHDNYDNKGAEDRAKMPIYNLVLERFEILKEFLTEKELIQAYTYLNIKWN